ncbi:hypothetical protein VTO42DRAFT_4713 [Malbranchea cinnamomea]
MDEEQLQHAGRAARVCLLWLLFSNFCLRQHYSRIRSILCSLRVKLAQRMAHGDGEYQFCCPSTEEAVEIATGCRVRLQTPPRCPLFGIAGLFL